MKNYFSKNWNNFCFKGCTFSWILKKYVWR
jgi:hypothetical protein